MLRHPQILTRSCPLRSLLLFFRESHVSAVPEHAAAAAEWRGQRREKERRHDGNSESGRSQNGSSVSTKTVGSLTLSSSNLDCQPIAGSSPNAPSKAFWESHCHHPQVPAAAKTKQAFYLVSSCLDCLINTTCAQCQGRTWDFCQTSYRKSHHMFPQQTSQYLNHMQNFFRPFSVPTLTTQISNFHTRPRRLSITFHPSRAAHQTAPRISNTWRDCLSPENEARCRQSLGPNLKLYQLEKERKGANPSQGSNQARWASVLVSLCSVEGEPSILFTLRSSTLKGRHKGDVSFAGGKSDPSDGDVVTTALREAREELGVTVTAEQVWGVLKPLRDASGMMIAPVLANLGPLEELTFKPNPAEVEEIFTLSLSHLCDPKNRGYTHFRTGSKYGYTLPVFRNGKHRVWGLTAVALEHTLKLIVSR